MAKENTSQCESNDNNKPTKNKKDGKKVVNIIADVLFYVVFALLVVVLICFAVDKFSGEETYPFFGYRGMVVLSNSMSFKNNEFKDFLEGHDEQFKKDDLIFSRKLKKDEELQVYDIVTFKMGKSTVIHRIVNIYEENGVKYYVTRGDAVPSDGTDSRKTIDQITGVYASNWGQIGLVIKFFQSLYGVLAMILCLTVLIITFIVLKFIKNQPPKAKQDVKNASMSANGNVEIVDSNVYENTPCESEEDIENLSYEIESESDVSENKNDDGNQSSGE